jgi:hypothetical protein
MRLRRLPVRGLWRLRRLRLVRVQGWLPLLLDRSLSILFDPASSVSFCGATRVGEPVSAATIDERWPAL